MAVRLDPFRNIVNVGWGGTFIFVTLVSDGNGSLNFGASGHPFPQMKLEVPDGHQDEAYAGLNDDLDLQQVFPTDEDLGSRSAILEWVSELNKTKEVVLPFIYGIASLSFAIEVAELFRVYRIELGVADPDPMEVGFYYGSSQADGAAVAKIRWVLYPAAARDALAEAQTRLDAAWVASGVGEPSNANDLDLFMDLHLLRDADGNILDFLDTQTYTARSPETDEGLQHTFVWDYANRSTVRPSIVDA